jgi:hypothetical protein
VISLAPFFFRNVFSEEGGPVLRVQSGSFPVFDQPTYQASAFLKPELTINKHKYVMFGDADGMGSAETQTVAQHKAISEALERWAFFEVNRSGSGAKYGFTSDRTSNGMAAFPGLALQARRRAHLEALERYALIGWWDGQFSSSLSQAPYPSVGVVRIHHGQSSGEVVILYRRAPAGFVSYGYASGSTMASAIGKAAIELVRCEYVISRHRARGGMLPVKDPMEMRCLHFSTPQGYAEFLERVNSIPTRSPARWKTIFDGEIRGPWSQWAKVWRHAVEMPTYDFLDTQKLFFFW